VLAEGNSLEPVKLRLVAPKRQCLRSIFRYCADADRDNPPSVRMIFSRETEAGAGCAIAGDIHRVDRSVRPF
jgi:hypothetical protein